MPLIALLGEILKSGKVTIATNSVETLEINAENKKIDIKALNKDIIKDTLAAAKGTHENRGIRENIKDTVGQLKTARSNLGMLKGVAEELSEAGITVTLTYKEQVVVTLGSNANPKLSSIATGTKAIEINSPRKLMELGI
jgi:hypothetical protein